MGECLLRQLRRLDAGQPNPSAHHRGSNNISGPRHAIGPSGIDDIPATRGS